MPPDMHPRPSSWPHAAHSFLPRRWRSDKNLAKLKDVTGYFADKSNVARLFTQEVFAADMEVITEALRGMILQSNFD